MIPASSRANAALRDLTPHTCDVGGGQHRTSYSHAAKLRSPGTRTGKLLRYQLVCPSSLRLPCAASLGMAVLVRGTFELRRFIYSSAITLLFHVFLTTPAVFLITALSISPSPVVFTFTSITAPSSKHISHVSCTTHTVTMTRVVNETMAKGLPSGHVVAARNSRNIAAVQGAPVFSEPWSPYTLHPSRAAGLRPRQATPGYPYPTELPRDLYPQGCQTLPRRHINDSVLTAMGSQFDNDGAAYLPRYDNSGAVLTGVAQNRRNGDQRQYEVTDKLSQQYSSVTTGSHASTTGKVGFANNMPSASN